MGRRSTRNARRSGPEGRRFLAGDRDQFTYHVDSIRKLEHECDELTDEVVRRLDRSFITPIDREDIHLLASNLDDVIDRLDATARRAKIFNVGDSPEGVDALCAVVEEITAEMLEAVTRMRDGNQVLAHCKKAKQLEEKADAIYHDLLGRLFETETDPFRLIKWKEIIDNLEDAVDGAEDVTSDVESIVLKHA